MIVKDEDVYQLSDLIVYELPEARPASIKGIREWSIYGRRAQCHAKEMIHIILGHDVKRDSSGVPVISDVLEMVNHEYLHALLFLLFEHRSGTSLDFYWDKYYIGVKPSSEIDSLLEGLSYSGIGFP